MTVTFQHPPTGTVHPFRDFSPGNRLHYPTHKSGVYIWGLKMEIDKVEKFVPIYVGIARDLGSRLWTHYNNNRTGGNWNWYVFDYCSIKSLVHLKDLYDAIEKADSNIQKDSLGSFKHRFSDKLIWFNDKEFFNLKLRTNLSSYYPNSGVQSSILPNGDLDSIKAKDPNLTNDCEQLRKRIECAKSSFDTNFYYIYHPMEASDKDWSFNKRDGKAKRTAREIEGITKRLLRDIGIFTGSDSKKKMTSNNIDIDLTNIQNELVNLGGLSYGLPYNYPLILKHK